MKYQRITSSNFLELISETLQYLCTSQWYTPCTAAQSIHQEVTTAESSMTSVTSTHLVHLLPRISLFHKATFVFLSLVYTSITKTCWDR
uniref:Uncharacterized protein n=1 Tax=Arundo donax TaxID=35708 RepID=A0A0A9FHR6_ARUDO